MKKYILVSVFFLAWFGVGTAHAATLGLSPASGSFVVGQTFDVKINLDTTNQQVDGIDLYFLHFNPSLLQVVDADPAASGIQIKSGGLLPVTQANSVDSTTGKIIFSQNVLGGTHYNGSGVLATVTFKALAAGTANLTFDFTKGNTADTNVAGSGVDQLTQVTNAQLTIGPANSTVTPPPNPTPNPTPQVTPQTTPVSTPASTVSSGPNILPIVGYGALGLAILGIIIWLMTRLKKP